MKTSRKRAEELMEKYETGGPSAQVVAASIVGWSILALADAVRHHARKIDRATGRLGG